VAVKECVSEFQLGQESTNVMEVPEIVKVVV
jgi:hypothetical protein